jgi:5-methyltetrahydrofolate--homocysteine methyltransferase
MGCSISESVALLENYEVDVIGINCTPGADKTLPLIKEMSQFTNKPLSVFPNAGEPQLKKGKVYYPQKPEDFKPYIKELIDNNVKIIGGCCGTNPEFITVIKEALVTI